MAIRANSLVLGPFLGGVRYDKPAEDCGPEELAVMTNTRLGEHGEVKVRNGWDRYEATALSGPPSLTLVHEQSWYTAASPTVSDWIVAGDKIFEHASGDWADRSGSITITAGNDYICEAINAMGKMYITNGKDAPFKVTAAGGTASAWDLDSKFTLPQHIAVFDNRAWAGNTNASVQDLWKSDIGDPETWSASSADYRFSEEITALVPFGNALSVHTEHGIYTLTPTGNSTIPYQQQQQTNQGSVSGRAVVTLPGERQLFVRRDGIYMWRGGDTVEKQFALGNRYWLDGSVNAARTPYAHAVFYERANEVWFYLPTNSTSQADNIVIYQTGMDVWFGPYTGKTFNCSGIIDGKPHGGDLVGLLHDLDTGTNDNGVAIAANYTTGSPAPAGDSVMVRWLYAKHYFAEKGDWPVYVAQQSSGLVGASQVVHMGGSAGVLGTDELGSLELGTASTLLHADSDLAGYDPHTYLQIHSNTLDQPFEFHRHLLQYRIIGNKRKRKSGIA